MAPRSRSADNRSILDSDMIGVIAKPENREVVQEFFELFKTPWEFYRQSENYDVVLCCGEDPGKAVGKLVLVYFAEKNQFDDRLSIQTGLKSADPCVLSYGT